MVNTSTVLIILAILSAGFLIYMGGYLVAEQLKRAVPHMDDAFRLAAKRLSEPDDPIKTVVTTCHILGPGPDIQLTTWRCRGICN